MNQKVVDEKIKSLGIPELKAQWETSDHDLSVYKDDKEVFLEPWQVEIIVCDFVQKIKDNLNSGGKKCT